MGQDDKPRSLPSSEEPRQTPPLTRRQRFQTAAYDQKIIQQNRQETDVQVIIDVPIRPKEESEHELFPVIQVPEGTRIMAFAERVTSVIVLLEGEAEEIRSRNLETNSNRIRKAGDVIHLELLRDDRVSLTSSSEIVAKTAVSMYQISRHDLETNNHSLNRLRERYIRKLMFQEADANARKYSQALLQSQKKISDLTDVLKSRLDDIKQKEMRPLRLENKRLYRAIEEWEPWVQAMFEFVPKLLEHQEQNEKNVDTFVEDFLIERCVLYDIIRDDLLDMLAACQEIDPKNSAPLNASILRLMAKLDEKFKRNMPQLTKLPT